MGTHFRITRAALVAAVAVAACAAPSAARADTIPGTWSSEATLPTTPFWQMLAASRPSDHLMATISVSKAGIRDAELYDPNTQSFTPMPAAPIVVLRSSTSLAWGADGYLYLAQSGVTDGTTVRLMERYSPTTNTWSLVARPPIAPGRLVTGAGARAVVLIGPSKTYGYNPMSHKWTSLPPMPTKVLDFAAVKVGSLVYVVGGTVGTTAAGGTSLLQIYNPASNRWSTGPAGPHRRIEASATPGTDGKLYVLGGTDVYGRAVPWVDVYNPTTHAWSSAAPTRDSPFAAALGSDGRIHTFGGYIPGDVIIRTGDVEASPTQPPSETAPPTVTVKPAPVIVTPRSLTNTRPVTVNLAWTASDPSGICFARVQRSVNGGPYTALGVTEPGAALSGTTPYAVFVPTATKIRFQVSLTDCTGVSTPWISTHQFVLSVAQQSAASYTGAWTAANSSAALGGSFVWSKQTGATATISFNASAIAWVSTNPPGFDGGPADIAIDGNPFATISTVGIRNVIYSKRWAIDGPHTMTITLDANPDNTPVTVDGFVLMHTTAP